GPDTRGNHGRDLPGGRGELLRRERGPPDGRRPDVSCSTRLDRYVYRWRHVDGTAVVDPGCSMSEQGRNAYHLQAPVRLPPRSRVVALSLLMLGTPLP